MSLDARPPERSSHDKQHHTIEKLTRRIKELEKIDRDHVRLLERLQNKLSEASRLLRASTTGLITLDKSGLINGVNPCAVEMLGTDSTYPLKKPVSLFIAQEDQSVFFINRSRIVAGTQKEPFEIRLKRRDGTLWSARIHAQPFEVPNQNLPGMLLSVEDISPYRQAMESLQFKEYTIDMLLSVIDDLAVWSTGDIDEIIRLTLEKVNLATGADRVWMAMFHDRRTRLSITHEWVGDDIESPAPTLKKAALSRYAGLVSQLKRRSSVIVADYAAVSPEIQSAHDGLHAPGTKSLLCSPLFYGRYLLGILGCDAVKQQAAWSEETQRLLKCIGSAIVQALLRRRLENAPAKVRETLLQFVASATDLPDDELLEYEGPIEVIAIDSGQVVDDKAEWRIEAGEPDDPELLGTGFIKDGKTVSIACKNCNRQKLLKMADIRELGTRLKATCICGNDIFIKIELRREHRKAVNFEGVFIRGPGDRIAVKSDDWGRILVTNLSRHGVGFKVSGKQDIRVKDRLRVKFTLDNTAGSVIQKSVDVRSVVDDFIGCEFTGKDPCDVTLGFYMMT